MRAVRNLSIAVTVGWGHSACCDCGGPADVNGWPDDAESTPSDAAAASACAFKSVKTRTGSGSHCTTSNFHVWPIGMAATDCHGWAAVDSSGKQQHNSANAIGCKPDGSFTFTQFTGNLNCSGSGTVKNYAPNACVQDVSTGLDTMAYDLTCCNNPSAAWCTTAVPSVSQPYSMVYLNGKACQ